MINPQEVLDRIMAREKLPTDADLARFLKTSRQTVNKWRHRESMKFGEILQVCEPAGYDLHWLLTGEEHASFKKMRAENEALKKEMAKLKGALEFCEKMLNQNHKRGGG